MTEIFFRTVICGMCGETVNIKWRQGEKFTDCPSCEDEIEIEKQKEPGE